MYDSESKGRRECMIERTRVRECMIERTMEEEDLHSIIDTMKETIYDSFSAQLLT